MIIGAAYLIPYELHVTCKGSREIKFVVSFEELVFQQLKTLIP